MIKGLKILNEDQIKEYEPYVNGLKAIHVPQAGITDYKLVSEKIFEILKNKNYKVENLIEFPGH